MSYKTRATPANAQAIATPTPMKACRLSWTTLVAALEVFVVVCWALLPALEADDAAEEADDAAEDADDLPAEAELAALAALLAAEDAELPAADSELPADEADDAALDAADAALVAEEAGNVADTAPGTREKICQHQEEKDVASAYCFGTQSPAESMQR